LSTWKGTSDGGDAAFHTWVAGNANATVDSDGANMYEISASTYDADGNLIESDEYYDPDFATSTNPTGIGAPFYPTYYVYNSQDRQIITVNPPNDDNNDVTYTLTYYDNLGETVETQQYLFNPSLLTQTLLIDDINNAQGESALAPFNVPVNTSTGDTLLSESTTAYDSLGQVYESCQCEVAPEGSPSAGTLEDYLPTDSWYDADGNVLATRTGAGPITKSVYNGAGEVIDSYTCADPNPTAGMAYGEATTVGSTETDVIEQTQTWYDADGNTIATADYQRLPNDTTDTGALTATDSYVTCTATFYDQAGRDIEDVDYGRQDLIDGSSSTAFFSYPSGNPILTNGVPSVTQGTLPQRQTTLPNTYLVTTTAYIDTSTAGPIVQTTDNAGIVTQTQSDLAGRTVAIVQNYTTGSPHTSNTAQDATTAELYDADGRLSAEVTFDATNTSVAPQETTYLYQSPLDGSQETAEISSDSTTPPLASQSVSQLTWNSATETATATVNGNGYSYPVGQWVLISGASPSQAVYNGWFQVTANTANSFSYALPYNGTLNGDSGSVQSLLTTYQSVSQLTWTGGTATATVGSGNGYNYPAGQWVLISGANVSGYNGWFQVTANTSTSFSFGLSANPGGSANTGRVQGLAPVNGQATGITDAVQTTYDLQGDVLTSTDQRGVTHQYSYDSAGQITDDSVTSFGNLSLSPGACWANEIETSYNDLGQVYQVTTLNGATILNQFEDAYDGWGNPTQEWQSVSGWVNTSSTPSVQYQYGDGNTSGENGPASYVRLNDVIYPNNARQVDYNYTNAVDEVMSRITELTDSTGLADSYTYLGADTIASEYYDLGSGYFGTTYYNDLQIGLDYSTNNFSGFDQFGRVRDQVWAEYGNSGSGLNFLTALDQYTYAYDADGNVLSKENVVANAAGQGMDEEYTYNHLNELTGMQRGQFQQSNLNTPTPTFANSPAPTSESWGLDSAGNMTNNNGNAETFDPANEAQTINGSTTGYDLAGNMTTTPEPSNPSTGLTCEYDAWDRLVEVSNGSTILAEYLYDGTGRRIAEFTNFTGTTPGTVTYSYYSGQNAIETRTGSATASPESLPVQYQYVFSPLGGKTPILRDGTFDSNGNPTPAGRLYYLTDANTNVTAVVGLSGSTWQVQERYVFDPYGNVTVYAVANNGGYGTVLGTSLSASTVGNTIGFASMSFDSATGLYYDEARWYSTAVSTFISRDPAQADENLYRYCGNEPIRHTDPTGSKTVGVTIYVDQSDAQMPHFNATAVQNTMNAWLKTKKIKGVLVIVVDGEVPPHIELGYHYDRTSHFANFGWWNIGLALGWTLRQYPYYLYTRKVCSVAATIKVGHGLTSGSTPLGSLISSAFSMPPGKFSGNANADEIQHDEGVEKDAGRAIQNWNLAYANALTYEVFFHSILGNGDYIFSEPPAGSLASHPGDPNRRIEISGSEVQGIMERLDTQ